MSKLSQYPHLITKMTDSNHINSLSSVLLLHFLQCKSTIPWHISIIMLQYKRWSETSSENAQIESTV